MMAESGDVALAIFMIAVFTVTFAILVFGDRSGSSKQAPPDKDGEEE